MPNTVSNEKPTKTISVSLPIPFFPDLDSCSFPSPPSHSFPTPAHDSLLAPRPYSYSFPTPTSPTSPVFITIPPLFPPHLVCLSVSAWTAFFTSTLIVTLTSSGTSFLVLHLFIIPTTPFPFSLSTQAPSSPSLSGPMFTLLSFIPSSLPVLISPFYLSAIILQAFLSMWWPLTFLASSVLLIWLCACIFVSAMLRFRTWNVVSIARLLVFSFQSSFTFSVRTSLTERIPPSLLFSFFSFESFRFRVRAATTVGGAAGRTLSCLFLLFVFLFLFILFILLFLVLFLF